MILGGMNSVPRVKKTSSVPNLLLYLEPYIENIICYASRSGLNLLDLTRKLGVVGINAYKSVELKISVDTGIMYIKPYN